MSELVRRQPKSKWTFATWVLAGPANLGCILAWKASLALLSPTLDLNQSEALWSGAIPSAIAVAGILFSLRQRPVTSRRLTATVAAWGIGTAIIFPTLYMLAISFLRRGTEVSVDLAELAGAIAFMLLLCMTYGAIVWLPPMIVAGLVIRFMLFRYNPR